MKKGILIITLAGLMACQAVPHQETYQARDLVADGVFTAGIEGPATGPDGYLYVVNFQKESTIGRVSADGKAELFVNLPEGSTGNGIRFDSAGDMYVADYTGHNILKISLQTRDIGMWAHNAAMHQPNDIAITKSGILFASDPDWKNESGQLWRIDSNGKTQLLESNMGTTNGVAVSPNQKQLYVNESVQRNVWVYDLSADGNISNKRLLIRFAEHGMDGMRCDDQGNLYIARYGAGVVAVVSPAGKLLREIPVKGKLPTNVAFGGKNNKQVFVTLQDRGAVETFFIK
jgi:gluconolactonase